MTRGRRAANADRLLAAKLDGEAWRLATEGGSINDAVMVLRALASGRNDLLAQAAGLAGGAWSAQPAIRVGTELFVAGLLIRAGSPTDFDALATWVAVGRERALQPPHTAS